MDAIAEKVTITARAMTMLIPERAIPTIQDRSRASERAKGIFLVGRKTSNVR